MDEPQKQEDSRRDQNGRFKPGVSGNPSGQAVGIKHRASKIKEILFNAFDRWGGEEKLLTWAQESKANEREFLKMVLSVLPKEMQVEGDGLGAKIVIVRSNERTEDKTETVPGRVSV